MIDSNTLKGPMGWSIASIAVIGTFCVFAISTILTPVLAPRGNDVVADSQATSLIEKHDQYALVDIERFNGRSAFFKPIPIPRPKPKYTPPPKRQDPDPPKDPDPIPPPRAPDSYMGPPLIAIIGDEAWFRGSGSGFDAVIRLQSGQERDGLMLVGTEEPTLALVQYRGWDFTLPLFTVDESFFLDEPPPASSNDFLEEVD